MRLTLDAVRRPKGEYLRAFTGGSDDAPVPFRARADDGNPAAL